MNIYASNRRVVFDYHILETIEAGIELTGFETKAVRLGRININGSYAIIKNNQIWLLNAAISPYQPQNLPSEFSGERTKRLLLKKKEIQNLIGRTKEKGLTLVPLRVYSRGERIKIGIALARKKLKSDKREIIKKKEIKKEIGKFLKK